MDELSEQTRNRILQEERYRVERQAQIQQKDREERVSPSRWLAFLNSSLGGSSCGSHR
jgi:hypothetical protein